MAQCRGGSDSSCCMWHCYNKWCPKGSCFTEMGCGSCSEQARMCKYYRRELVSSVSSTAERALTTERALMGCPAGTCWGETGCSSDACGDYAPVSKGRTGSPCGADGRSCYGADGSCSLANCPCSTTVFG